MSARPPIVTILGHVDHGKTSLLDYIRKSKLADREHGGITQRIGAYEITTGIQGYDTDVITFIDTPGHEAFSKLRSRGTTIADIAILVIDAKDSVKPQTEESIAHIKSSGIPYIVALNKTDLPDAKPDKVKNDLLKYQIIVEDKGGEIPALNISAKTGNGIRDLLETILLISADKKLTFDSTAQLEAYTIETKKDKRGIVGSIIIKNGKLRVGDTVYAGQQKFKVRTMVDDVGKNTKEVQPSTPVELLGFNEIPEVGELITSSEAQSSSTDKASVQAKSRTLSDLERMFKEEEEKPNVLTVIIKADSHGSLEAILDSLAENENINFVLTGVGDVHKSDIFLAKTTQALVIGFSVKIDNEVKQLSKQEKVIIKTYTIIYELLEELEEVSKLLFEREQAKKNLKGEAKVLATFQIEGETVFGIRVNKGKINLSDAITVFRDGNQIAETKLVSLKHKAKSVQEAKKDTEAGMVFYPIADIKVGDVIKSLK